MISPNSALWRFSASLLGLMMVLNVGWRISSPKRGDMRHEQKLANLWVNFSTENWPCFMTLVPACLPGRLWVSNTDLEMVIAAFLAMVCGRKELQDHIFASLTHIIAHFDLFSSTLQNLQC